MAFIEFSPPEELADRWPKLQQEYAGGLPDVQCLQKSPDGKYRCTRRAGHVRDTPTTAYWNLHVVTRESGKLVRAEWLTYDNDGSSPNPVVHNPIKPIADPVDLSMKTGPLCQVTIEEWDLLEDATEDDYARLPTYDDLEDRRKAS